ncbi:uncharacterized protein C8Q71DRAFT_726005 [Rhodofomes roseus]|uniref:F-box domain-containing protein n=1 Tax=Rhodofomes roseus TaxID=34475 RepID=A0A4Y9XQ50_9APHY|nr:uncharacterized protein C8Q71DRAFT_726005 [Rhodofomes roseus]KAH9832878.1 hypothetical protein C8Q71DRAFT_726005 [Rhodofomes roseus]TFY52225.1 hypothetical protein EVJ58_g10132 [Rhodofomes roseus]
MSSASSSTTSSGGSIPHITDPLSRATALNWFGYHPREFDETVLYIPKDRSRGATTDESRPTPPPLQASVASAGDLGKFPLELLSLIAQYTDLRSTSALRLVNRRMRLIVDESVPYKFLVRHIPNTLETLDTADASQHFTVDELYHTLCTRTCSFCNEFGTYLWIPECVRCCFNCLSETPHLMALIESDAKMLFGVTKKSLVDVPSMLSIPGTYGMVDLYHGRRFRLYSQRRVVQAAIAHHGGNERYDTWLETHGKKAREVFARPSRRGVSKPTFYLSARFMAATPFPYLELATRKLHQGLICRGCQIATIRSRHLMVTQTVAMGFIRRQARMWLEDGLFEHFKECEDAKDIWVFMQEARNRPTELPGKAQNGDIIATGFLRSLIERLWNGPPPQM